MGRTKTKKKTAARIVEAPTSAPLPTTPSIPALLEKAQSLIVQCDYDLARRFVTRILEQQPSNAEAKEMLGVVQLEMGEIEAARVVSSILRAADTIFIENYNFIDVHYAAAPKSGCTVSTAALCSSLSCPTERR
jgi:hypothetical protein